jgi:hypothetical protein
MSIIVLESDDIFARVNGLLLSKQNVHILKRLKKELLNNICSATIAECFHSSLII